MLATKLSKSLPLPFQLSLRIRHPSMDPSYLSREFAIEPEYCFRAGEPRPSRSGLALATVHTESYWLAALDPAAWLGDMAFTAPASLAIPQPRVNSAVSKSLAWALSVGAAHLDKAHGLLLHQIRSEGGQVSLLISLSPFIASSFVLTPEVSRIFSELGITLECEMTSD